jgi:peptidoglycan/xylan/chitin deacetylase (PgdA/CDA1 family)
MGPEQRKGNAVILMYHRIADEDTELCVPPAEFRDHLALLRDEGCNVLPLHELASALRCDDVPERAVAITLDDGYLDALTEAAPALQASGLPATFFVVTATLDGPSEFWWETLERIFIQGRLPGMLDVALPAGVATMPTLTPAEKRTAFDAVRCEFYALPLDDRQARIEALLRWSGLPCSVPPSGARAMTTDEVRTLNGLPGMDIGSHSHNHLLLPAQPMEAKRREIVLSKQRLEAVLGQAIHSFAYPHGAFDEASEALVEEAGFALAVTTGNQQATPQSRPMVLPRCGVQSGDDLRSRLNTLFAAEPQKQYRRTNA